MKIAAKINFTFLSIFATLFLIVGVLVTIFTLNIFRGEISNNLYYNGRAIAEHIRTFLNDQKKTGAVLAGASVYRDFLKEPITTPQYKIIKDKMDKRLNRTLQVDNNMIEIFILDKNGKIIASSSKQQEGKDKSSDPYFINGQKEVFIKDIYLSPTTNQINYTISAPITDEDTNDLLGVSVVRYDINVLDTILASFGESYKTKEVFLINKDRYFLTPSLFLGNSVVLTQTVDSNNAKQCFDQNEIDYITENGYSGLEKNTGQSLVVENKDYRQIDVLGTHNYIPETGWCLITKIDKSEILTASNSIASIFIVSLVIILVLLIFSGYWFSKIITKPIENLRRGTEIIGKGDLDYKVGTNAKDEIGQLSREFDQMTLNLKQSQENIESKVEQRTKELQRLNQAMVGRELKMIELKQKNKELSNKK